MNIPTQNDTNKPLDKHLRQLFTTLLFFVLSLSAWGQPSSSIQFACRLYDKHGHIVDENKFRKEWKMFDGDGFPISLWEYNVSQISHDSSKKYFCFELGVIFAPYVFTLCHQKDTMTLIFPNKNYLLCDSLTIRDGSFIFDFTCTDEEKIYLKLEYGGRMSFCQLNNINWELQRQKSEKSIYYRKHFYKKH